MFLSVEWAKRWLPSVFLLLSLFLPWWTMIEVSEVWIGQRLEIPARHSFYLSFPWAETVSISIAYGELWVNSQIPIYNIPYLCLDCILILAGALCGLSGKSKIRTLGGLLGIAGLVSYFITALPKPTYQFPFEFRNSPYSPYFGSAYHESAGKVLRAYPEVRLVESHVWFLSVGFYLALAGSLMLLLPLIRTLVERLRKRL